MVELLLGQGLMTDIAEIIQQLSYWSDKIPPGMPIQFVSCLKGDTGIAMGFALGERIIILSVFTPDDAEDVGRSLINMATKVRLWQQEHGHA